MCTNLSTNLTNIICGICDHICANLRGTGAIDTAMGFCYNYTTINLLKRYIRRGQGGASFAIFISERGRAELDEVEKLFNYLMIIKEKLLKWLENTLIKISSNS